MQSRQSVVMAQRLIEEYLAFAGHGTDAAGPVFSVSAPK
jgi:hypothetical protein